MNSKLLCGFLFASFLALLAEGITSLSRALQGLRLHLLILDLLGRRGLRLGLDHLARLTLRWLLGSRGRSRRSSRARAGRAARIYVDFRSLDVDLPGSKNYEGSPNLEGQFVSALDHEVLSGFQVYFSAGIQRIVRPDFLLNVDSCFNAVGPLSLVVIISFDQEV